MSEQEQSQRRVSRAGAVKAALLGAVGIGVGAAARPGKAEATQGDPVLLGLGVSGATGTTVLTNNSGDQAQLAGGGIGAGGFGNTAGVRGVGRGTGNGVEGSGQIGVRAIGLGGPGIGVQATGAASPQTASTTTGGNGIQAQGGDGSAAAGNVGGVGMVSVGGDGDQVGGDGIQATGGGPNANGVTATGAGTGNGVSATGGAGGGIGVWGVGSGTGAGVIGTADTGSGVIGDAGTSGQVAVEADATLDGQVGVLARHNLADGVALQVVGAVQFQTRSGVAHIKAGASTVTVKVSGMTSQSIVIATPQQDEVGVYVRSAVAKAGKFTITIGGGAPTGGLKIGWFVLG